MKQFRVKFLFGKSISGGIERINKEDMESAVAWANERVKEKGEGYSFDIRLSTVDEYNTIGELGDFEYSNLVPPSAYKDFKHSKRYNKEAMARAIIMNLIECHLGEENKTTYRDLIFDLDLPDLSGNMEATRAICKKMVEGGALIGSDTQGIWWIATEDELNKTVEILHRKASGIRERAAILINSFQKQELPKIKEVKKKQLINVHCVRDLINALNNNNDGIIYFGKHAGKKISETPEDYIEWCKKEDERSRRNSQ